MPFVLDASMTVAWFFDEAANPDAAAVLGRLAAEQALAPAIWWYEVRNALIMKERRTPNLRVAVDAFRSKLNGLPIEIDDNPDEETVMAIARLRGLTFYDAAYLELGVRLNLPLATLDRTMAAAALAQGVALV